MTINKLQKSEYPLLLRQIPRLPETMDIAGVMPSDDHKFLCVIGSRKCSSYGTEACRKLILGLAGYPVVIVSGLAIGIDSLAHETAIEARLKTISFPGSGLSPSVIYPYSKRQLANKIVESGGALVSSFPPKQESSFWTFPARNRLMAGISHAILIIEAARGSGTLITADYAAEFGRDIMTVPGSIFAELSYGPHMLMRRGATPIGCAEDILEALGFAVNCKDGMSEALPNFSEMSLSKEQRVVVEHLKREPMSSTGIIEGSSLTSSQFNMIISELELRGIVKQQEGRYSLA